MRSRSGSVGASSRRHPAALTERRGAASRLRRERLERELADEWCASEEAPLYVDGGIGRNERMATAMMAIGVGQRHHTLYGGAGARAGPGGAGGRRAHDGLPARGRPADARSLAGICASVTRQAANRRGGWSGSRVRTGRQTSRSGPTRFRDGSWRSAFLLRCPDARWHALAYGIRDCKEMLRAVMTIA